MWAVGDAVSDVGEAGVEQRHAVAWALDQRVERGGDVACARDDLSDKASDDATTAQPGFGVAGFGELVRGLAGLTDTSRVRGGFLREQAVETQRGGVLCGAPARDVGAERTVCGGPR